MSNNWHQEETYKSMIQISSVVMKFIFTANGGAAVALLTFMGQLRAKDIAPPELSCALLFFLLGVLFGGLTAAFSYMTQLTLFREGKSELPPNKHHIPMRIAALFALFGIVSFGVGSWLAVGAI
ncbi:MULTISPECIES: hypothetical protein [Halomonadaceae]|uniref:DUF202 domain-containing protein n=2 Tax=Vreelandella TaxID=3137766 RepID=A0A7Z0RXZ8_9GAMM|nr:MULTISPECIES: hypothetical protein [Halomonas]NYS77702.1 hypothetical protein [Halomonas glaciei]|tara:strand:+ start:939 stop:1310 length:372 start_codon:yes stop_codon:yes gene_type:complete